MTWERFVSLQNVSSFLWRKSSLTVDVLCVTLFSVIYRSDIQTVRSQWSFLMWETHLRKYLMLCLSTKPLNQWNLGWVVHSQYGEYKQTLLTEWETNRARCDVTAFLDIRRKWIWNLSFCINRSHLTTGFRVSSFPAIVLPEGFWWCLRGWEHVTSKPQFIASVRSQGPGGEMWLKT